MNYSLFQELFISNEDKSIIESADIAFDVWFYVIIGIVVTILFLLVLGIIKMTRIGFDSEIFLFPFTIGIILHFLIYIGMVFLINYAYNYLKNNALQAQDDKKAHKYTIYTIIFVLFLLFWMFVNIIFIFVRKIKGKYHIAKNIRGDFFK